MKGSDLHKQMFKVFQSQTLSTGDKLSAIAVRIEEIENTRLPRVWEQLKQKMFYKLLARRPTRRRKLSSNHGQVIQTVYGSKAKNFKISVSCSKQRSRNRFSSLRK
jgi:hypothetical protein